MNMRFWKYQALGNDFIIVDDLDGRAKKDEPLVKGLCKRHFGVGADGVLYLQASDKSDFGMVMMNPDGTEAEMCGNGSICMGRYLLDHGFVQPGKDRIRLETRAGEVDLYPLGEGMRVRMPPPRFERERIPMKGLGECIDEDIDVGGHRVKITALSLGNPHAVVFADYSREKIEELAPKLESHALFPSRTNVEFVRVVSPNEIALTVYERGAGFTLACGTGACASCVAGVVTNRLEPEVKVHLPGGEVKVFVGDQLFMESTCKEVFRGEYEASRAS
jgi:diaminopimelate epimerase